MFTLTVFTTLRTIEFGKAKIGQRIQAGITNKVDMATITAIATIGAAFGNVLLTTKANATIATITGFMAVQNAAGPIDPPDMAAFAFNNSGFPILEGNLTPVGSYPESDQPTPGVQQSTNMSVWGYHTGGSGRSFFDNDNGSSFIERSLRGGLAVLGSDDFEQRFTQACLDGIDGVITETDCLAWTAFEDVQVNIEVPFELWNIGDAEDLPVF